MKFKKNCCLYCGCYFYYFLFLCDRPIFVITPGWAKFPKYHQKKTFLWDFTRQVPFLSPTNSIKALFIKLCANNCVWSWWIRKSLQRASWECGFCLWRKVHHRHVTQSYVIFQGTLEFIGHPQISEENNMPAYSLVLPMNFW